MSRTKGTYTLTSNIEPKVGAPLDARTVVKLKTDLTANNTFPYPYKGLTVFVEEENKKYTLIGADTTNIDNWVEEGSASTGGHTIVDPESTALTQRTNLQFLDANVTDDSTDDTTVVENITVVNDESDITNAPDGIYMVDREETIDINADEVIYNNTDSGLQADNAQDAIDEVVASLGTAAYRDVPASGDASFNQVVLGKDARLTYYDRNRYDAQVKCSTNIVEGNIIVGLNGLYHHLNDGTVFDITYPILYAKNNMAAGAANKSNYDSLAIDITVTQQMTLTQFLPVYIKGILSGNMFNPISTTPLTQEMVQDGYHYMLLGLASTTTNIYLFHDHRIFAHNGGSFCELIGNIGTAAYKDVPASGDASTTQVVTGNDSRLTDARTPVSHTHATSDITGLGTAATTNTTNNITQGGTDIPTAGAVWSAIDNLPEPMILKGTLGTGGTITSLPTAAADNEGFTYKVITAGTYASQAAKVGDFFVSCKPVGASAYEWVWFPSGDESFTDTWRNVKVNGTEQLGTGISSGAVDFVNGTNTTVAFDASGNKISVSVPAVSSTSAGVAPKGAAVSSQSQTTKFLREDGTWAAPSYTVDTNTTYTVATGDSNGQIKVTPSSGSAYNVGVKGLGSSAYANLANTVMEVGKASSRSTATVGTWTAMCNSTQTGSPTLPTASKWWNVVNLNNWTDSSTNWVSQLAVATQDSLSGVWWRANNAGGTSIDSSTWHRLAEGDASGNAANANTVNGLTVQTAVPANAVFTDHTYNFGGTTFYSGNSGTAEHNANSIQYNGDYYYTSNGPATTKGATTTDGGLYAQFHSTTWGGQIAQDYRNGNLFVRGKNNGTLTEWSPIASGLKIAWGRYGTTSSTTKIKINIKPTAAWMLSFVVTIYQGYVARKFMISGYQYGSNHWYSPTAVLLGSSNNTSASVYFGYDSNNNLWVGFDGGNYTGVCISDVCNGYTQLTDLGEMFTISNVSSLTTLQTTVTAGKPDAATVNGLTLSLVT